MVCLIGGISLKMIALLRRLTEVSLFVFVNLLATIHMDMDITRAKYLHLLELSRQEDEYKRATKKIKIMMEAEHGWQEIGKTIEALTTSGICTG